MKVKVLSRNPDDYLRETKRDIQKGKLQKCFVLPNCTYMIMFYFFHIDGNHINLQWRILGKYEWVAIFFIGCASAKIIIIDYCKNQYVMEQ